MNTNEEDSIRMSNGHLVMSTLTFLGGYATQNELLDQIIASTGQPEELVEEELKRILTNGLRNGYLSKNGNTYLLPYLDNDFEVDSQRGSQECEMRGIEEIRKEWSEACQALMEIYRADCKIFRDRIFSEYFAIAKSSGSKRIERYEQLIQNACITDPPLQKVLLGLWCSANFVKKTEANLFEKFQSICDKTCGENTTFSKAVKPVCEMDCKFFLNRVVKELFASVKNAGDKMDGRSQAMKYKHTSKELQTPLFDLWNTSFDMLQSDSSFNLFQEFERNTTGQSECRR